MKSVSEKRGLLKLIGAVLDIIGIILIIIAIPVTDVTIESVLRLIGVIMIIVGTYGIFFKSFKEKLTKLGLVGSILIALSFILIAVSVFLDESEANLVNPDMAAKVVGLISYVLGGLFITITSKEHRLMKSLFVIVSALVIFSWVIPYGYFNGGDFYEYGLLPIGIVDLSTAFYNALTYSADKVVFLIVLAGFYGVLTKISGYQKLVSNLAEKFSSHPILVSVVMSVLLFVLTSLLRQTLIVLLFVPLCISILLNMKIDKLTTFAITFGSVLVGVLGATYGTEGLMMFNNYMNMMYGSTAIEITTGLTYRFIIAAVALVLYNFFICMRLKKVLTDNKKNSKNADIEDDPFKIEAPKKKSSAIPVVVVLFIIAALAILTHIAWNTNFGTEVFINFHEWLTELAPVEDFPIMQYLLGSSQNVTAFGEYTYLFVLCSTLILAAGLIAYLYRMKFDEFIDAFYNGTKKIFKPLLCAVAVYLTFAICYNSPIIVTITNWLLNLVEGFNPYLTSLTAFITAALNNDLGYTSYVVSSFLISVYSSNLELVHVIYTSMAGVAQVFLPTSFVLVLGLTLMKLDYKAWFKYIWLFVVGMIIILLVLFTVVTYI